MLVEMKNLVKRYGNNLAVDNVNLEIAEGEVFGLWGQWRCKTTIINMLLGLTKVDGGDHHLRRGSAATGRM